MKKPAHKPLWINGIRYNDLAAATAKINLLIGWKVSTLWVSRIASEGTSKEINGVIISAIPLPELSSTRSLLKKHKTHQRKRAQEPPKQEASEQEASEQEVFPLLRYPPGKTPVDRGINHAQL
jgi:hypothetical protein